jgi:Zn-dependent membrane protease YugP
MNQKIEVTPGKITVLQAKANIVVISLLLVFGLVFGFVVLQETSASEVGLMILIGGFFCIYIVVCLALIIMFARIISQKKNSLVDVNIGDTGGFDARLRKLEQLKQEGLISEAEYQAKRQQILQEKW